ncbi:hypothetical protein [Duganella violaceipulchra]|uniref:Bulb-type lectin domain-containing protein n=1 Tax=Duganella violaceipulchra TaxID=2849652 RepID=A0AA41L1P9_9BURK|nr:hypothetical protein [Duganella violaceicalia]MBV6321133.1 hypothetical protein [Duganella violaceicalia]MCP2009622.1 hypothetical protein [Duganella violaceicalia]
MKLACGALLLLSAFSIQAKEIGAGQSLRVGQTIESDDGKYFLIQQGDGNLVVYRKADMKPIWAAYANGEQALIQTDGNFVQYRGETIPANAVWSSGTGGGAFSRNYRLGVSNYGNAYVMDARGYIRWTSNADSQTTAPIRTCVNPYPMPGFPTYFSPSFIPLCFKPGQPDQSQTVALSCNNNESKAIASYYGASLGPCPTWP